MPPSEMNRKDGTLEKNQVLLFRSFPHFLFQAASGYESAVAGRHPKPG
jgi:hypothetical protein